MAGTRATVVALLCVVCVGGSIAQVVSSGKTVRRSRVADDPIAAAVVRAEAAIEKKDYATAEQTLKEALKSDPKNYRAWYDLGFVLNAQGHADDALDAYRKSVEADPKVFESNLNLGLMLARSRSPEAEKYLRAATELTPTAARDEGLARAWVSLGHVLEKSKPHEALNAFHRAAALAPKDAEPHLSAAIIAETLGDTATAEDEFKAAADRDSKSDEAVAGLATVYMKTQRLPEAESALRKYLALDPNSVTAHVNLGRVLLAQKKNDEAVAELEAALQLKPSDVDARRQVAALYESNKQYDKAAAQYKALVQLSPNNGELHYWLGHSLLQQRKFQEAQPELLRAIELKPDMADAYSDLALAASENKDYVLTIKVLDARTKFSPDVPATLFLRATAYDHLQAYKEATENYQKFLLAANGRYPDQEWQARHRIIAIDPRGKKKDR